MPSIFFLNVLTYTLYVMHMVNLLFMLYLSLRFDAITLLVLFQVIFIISDIILPLVTDSDLKLRCGNINNVCGTPSHYAQPFC